MAYLRNLSTGCTGLSDSLATGWTGLSGSLGDVAVLELGGKWFFLVMSLSSDGLELALS